MAVTVSDWAVRARALDPGASFIVQAPAGSGKTELLTRRYLALLSTVEEPEEILAITFTRKAAAEMRLRVMAALREAAQSDGAQEGERLTLSRAALSWARAKGWRLLENPARLRVMTIDGFNGYLVGRMPWLSRLGPSPAIAADPEALYAQAAKRALRELGGKSAYVEPLKRALDYFDNKPELLVSYLSKFLAKRDQWLRKRATIDDPEGLIAQMVEGLNELLLLKLAPAHAALSSYLGRMCALARWASDNLEEGSKQAPYLLNSALKATPEHIAHYRALTGFFLTAAGELRNKVTKTQGFPPGEKAKINEMKGVLGDLEGDQGAQEALKVVAALPDPDFSGGQWAILSDLIRVADLALACLMVEFRAGGEVDFQETALRAAEALGTADDPSDLLLGLDRRISHILVDEFQDTSHLQFELLEKLTSGWQRGDGRTLFLVGDPMQSIYRFREADVSLFQRARAGGLGQVSLVPLTLETNFRSDGEVVSWFNASFPVIFPRDDNPATGAVAYSASVAAREGGGAEPVSFCPFLGRDDAQEAKLAADEAISALSRDEASTVAILVRARTHLSAIVSELKERGQSFRAEELAPLGGNLAARDLAALARALADPADRLHWLSVLRAPWCGLSLSALHDLFSGDRRPVPVILRELAAAGDGRFRTLPNLERCWGVLSAALAEAGRRPFRDTLEGAWCLLGAPSYLSEGELANASLVLAVVSKVSQGGLPDLARLGQELDKLKERPDPAGEKRLMLMTIHKAKGLEFDTVILPGLGRPPRQKDKELITWEKTPGGGFLLAAAPPERAGREGGVSDFLRDIEKEREKNELVRLFYVAATRAKKRLLLFGHCAWNETEGRFKPVGKSFLELLWPLVRESFQGAEKPEDSKEAFSPPRALTVERLGAGYAPPPLSSPPFRPPAAREVFAEEMVFDWAREERKNIGIVTHLFLERIAKEGFSQWNGEKVRGALSAVTAKLEGLGVPAARLAAAASEVSKALKLTLNDPRAALFLGAGEGAVSEYSLTVPTEDGFKTRRIDRTYLDGEGTRWVVDFKTTTHEGGDREGFLKEQAERYEGQLKEYAELLRLSEPGRRVRAAIYYPLLGEMVEIAV